MTSIVLKSTPFPIERHISYAEKLKSNTREDSSPKNEVLKEAIHIARKEEMDKQRRSGNIIVHGIEEDIPNMNDMKWVENLCVDLHVRVTVKRVSRIGVSMLGKKRLLMVAVKNEAEKFKILSNLCILKGLERTRKN